jgi:hypothetical protein
LARKPRRTYQPRVVGDQVMTPADLKRLHKYMMEIEGISVIRALALLTLVKPPLTKDEIVAQEKHVKQLRDHVGLRRWCQLYAGEMEQARILVEVLRRQK